MPSKRFLWLFLTVTVVSIYILSLYRSGDAQTQPACAKHINGDANCDNLIDLVDFEIWRKEYTGAITTKTADFDSSGTVTLADFEIWRKGYFSATPSPSVTSGVSITPQPTVVTNCTHPGQLIDLTNWKITLPIGSSSPTEIKQPQLATYSIDPWFKVKPDCSGVLFRAHTSSPVTTSNSNYPRSELREMTNNGVDLAAWPTTSGTHTMFIDQAILSVPKGKRHLVAGQIHDSSSDLIVIRLEYPKLFVDIGGTEGPTLDPAYTLGKRFTAKFEASGGKVNIYYNGGTTPAYTLTSSSSKNYFKAGAYPQSNCTRETEYGSTCADDNYGEVVIYKLTIEHK